MFIKPIDAALAVSIGVWTIFQDPNFVVVDAVTKCCLNVCDKLPLVCRLDFLNQLVAQPCDYGGDNSTTAIFKLSIFDFFKIVFFICTRDFLQYYPRC